MGGLGLASVERAGLPGAPLQPLPPVSPLVFPDAPHTVACIQNFNWAVLMLPLPSKYQSSHSSGVVFR